MRKLQQMEARQEAARQRVVETRARLGRGEATESEARGADAMWEAAANATATVRGATR
jgi:uncharacterized protein (UPF0548 family)